MKFPDRPNGATGALVRANQFDQSPTAPFSKTRQGSQVIHKRNGDLLIRKDDNAAPPPPYLLWSGPWVAESGAASDTLRRIGLDPGDAFIEEAPETTTATIRSANNGVYVGDGYFLDMCVSYDASIPNQMWGASFPRLRSIDNLEGAIVPAESPLNVSGANVALDNVEPLLVAETIYGFVHPTFCACGWKNETDRYVFCIFGLLPSGSSRYRSKYVVYVGNTATRKLRRVDLPTLPNSAHPLYLTGWGVGAPIYETAWWGIETLYASPAGFVDNDQGPAKLYAVGKGHMLTLLVPQERVEVSRLEGTPRYSTHPLRLPVGSAPHLVRSRDFGETWTVERADFLAADLPMETIELPDDYPDGVDTTYDYPFQPVSWHSGFIAAPMGGGRVAIAAYGRPAVPPTDEDLALHTRRMAVQRALRFFVSDTNGENFVRKPWPMDAMWACISFCDYFDPGTYTQAWPLFFPNQLPAHRYSMGAGNFTIASVSTAVKYPEKLWGNYPDAYPVTVWTTNDYGDTWTGQRLPAECMPMVDNLAEYKAVRGLEQGDGFAVSDALLLTRFMLGMSAPSKPADGANPAVHPELVALFEGWRVPTSVCATSGDVTTMRRVVDFFGSSYIDPQFSNILWRSPELHYTGDIGSLLYPDDVDPAHPEFEER